MRTAVVPAGSERTPMLTEEPCPASGVGLTTKRTGSPSSARASRSCSGPATTNTGRMPAEITRSTACRMMGLPSSSRRSFGRPILRDNPAARTMAAVTAAPKTYAPRTWIRGALWARAGSLLGGRRLHGTLGEDSQQVLFVLDGALEIGLDVHALCRARSRRLDRGRIGGLAGFGGLDPPWGGRPWGGGGGDGDRRAVP